MQMKVIRIALRWTLLHKAPHETPVHERKDLFKHENNHFVNLSFASVVYLRFLKTKNIKYELIYNTGHLYFVKHSHKQKYLLFFFPFLIIFFFLGFGLPISYQKEKIST